MFKASNSFNFALKIIAEIITEKCFEILILPNPGLKKTLWRESLVEIMVLIKNLVIWDSFQNKRFQEKMVLKEKKRRVLTTKIRNVAIIIVLKEKIKMSCFYLGFFQKRTLRSFLEIKNQVSY